MKENRITFGEEEIHDLRDEPIKIFIESYKGRERDVFFTFDNKAHVTKRGSNLIFHGKDAGKGIKDKNVKIVYAGLEDGFYLKEDFKKLLNSIYNGRKSRIKPFTLQLGGILNKKYSFKDLFKG